MFHFIFPRLCLTGSFLFRIPLLLWLFPLAILLHQAAADAAVPRTPPSVGSILSASGDAQIRLVEATNWLTAETEQELLAGDGLRTGPLGTMALLFVDRTQIRVQRNSILTVKSIAQSPQAGTTVIRLDQGGTWSRAVTGSQGVKIETPAATAAIRGTDWSVTVDAKGGTRLIVLDGEVILENTFGRVSAKRGEIAFAEIGKAPTKTLLVNPQDREQQIYNLSLIDAMDFYKLTSLKVKERRREKERIEAVAAAQRSGGQWLDLAELSYDLGDWQLARQALRAVGTEDPQVSARAGLVAGYLAYFDFDFSGAEHQFAAVAPMLDPDRRLTALVGRTASLIQLRRIDEAKGILDKLEQEYGDNQQFLLFKIIMATFSGDLPEAIAQVRQQALRFPDDPDFPAAEGILAILLARPDQAREAAERTLALDPGNSNGHQILAEYFHTYPGHSEKAIETIRQGLAANDKDSTLWGQLGYFHLMISEYRLAEEAFLQSMALNPKSVTCMANYSILLLEQYRIAEAEELLGRIERLDPGRDFTKIIEGRVALQTDDIPAAQQSFLEATTLNPAMSESALGLAQTYYQENELARARQALDNAARMDPNDPLIPLVGAIIANDRAYADQAIEYAREAIRLYRQRGGEGITGLASTRGGNNTLGSAFANLGLTAWANYYNELSFDPYSAESYLYRASQETEGFASLFQGLLLEPLATSGRNRFVDFYRRPFTDSELRGSVGWPGNGTGYGGGATIQGFFLAPKPSSYYLAVDHLYSPDDRDNADLYSNSFIGGLGINITPDDRLVLDAEVVSATNGIPGAIDLPDPDDEQEGQSIRAGLGYSHYFNARNIVIGRFMAEDLHSTVNNEDPLGSKLSSLDYSLILNFGPEAARALHELGLEDVTDPDNPDSPSLYIGGPGPYLASTIPPGLDTKPNSRLRVDYSSLSLNVRHMFTMREVDFTYGAEVKPFRRTVKENFIGFVPRDPGTGRIQGPGGSVDFVFGDPVPMTHYTVEHGLAGNMYFDALWRLNKNIWLEGGLSADHADDDTQPPMNRIDPRIGFAWQPGASDWLRLVFREDIGAAGEFSLAPVTTVGLTPLTEHVADDGRVATYIARWDREWTSRFFTALELRRRDIHDFSISVPDSFLFYYVDKGRIDQASLSADLWLKGGFGLFARATFRATENRNDGPENGNSLPLIPEQDFATGITWIHPLQIKVSLGVHLVGERAADTYDTTMLGGYETVDLGVTWQPLDKHLELGLTATNLLDREYDVGRNIPADGTAVIATAKWRF